MIYVHVPFCRSFCTYCGFYSEICRRAPRSSTQAPGSREDSRQVQNRLFEEYAAALRDEIAVRSTELVAARRGSALGPVPPSAPSLSGSPAPDTLYIGGGTPSVLPLPVLEDIVGCLGPSDYEEFTIEVNPDDIVSGGPEYVSGLRRLGVNRVSMGVQSFDDGILKWMNRRHDAAGAREAFRLLRACGFDNISIDLIFGLSQLSADAWADTVLAALALEPEHISAYQLSIEEDSALERMVADGRYVEASDEQCRSQYDALCRMLAEAGYVHYEISNWARPGREAVHNSAYWLRVPYVGLGPGAHSFSLSSSRSVSSLDTNQHPIAVSSPPAVQPSPDLSSNPLGAASSSAVPSSSPVQSSRDLSSNPLGTASSPAVPSSSPVQSSPDLSLNPIGVASSSAVPSPSSARPSSYLYIGAPGVRSWNSQELPRREAGGSLRRWSSEQEALSAREAAEEAIMLGLRTSAGLPLVVLRTLSPDAPTDTLLSEGALQLFRPAPAAALSSPLSAPASPATDVQAPDVQAPDVFVRIPEDHFFVSDDIISRLLP